MSIKELSKKREVRIAILVFLLVLCAYGIGYIMGRDSNRAPIVIENVTP
ncbi:MAG: hypothetical protein NUV96_00920 [Candidatus Colwellbacteria bacterium]|nr:hypothetical protein [Candidatus Colwellbacteria bacterium]